MIFWMLVLVISGLIYCSIWLRVWNLRSFDAGQVKQSTLSIAIQELVGTAGGVYLSILALTSFLKLELPEQLILYNISFDPLALFAVSYAIVQPLGRRVFSRNH